MSATQDRGGRTIAWFDTLEQVRAAGLELERRGVDSIHIRASSVDNQGDRRAIDSRSMGWIGRRAAVGAVVGATVGALVGFVAGSLLGAGSEVWYYVVGGLIFGTPPGFFYAVGTRLPAEPNAFDTFGDDSPGDAWISVEGTDDVRRTASEVLRALEPTRIDAA